MDLLGDLLVYPFHVQNTSTCVHTVTIQFGNICRLAKTLTWRSLKALCVVCVCVRISHSKIGLKNETWSLSGGRLGWNDGCGGWCRWCVMVSGGLRWCVVVYGGVWWCGVCVVCDGVCLWWCAVFSDVLWWMWGYGDYHIKESLYVWWLILLHVCFLVWYLRRLKLLKVLQNKFQSPFANAKLLWISKIFARLLKPLSFGALKMCISAQIDLFFVRPVKTHFTSLISHPSW